MTKRSTEEKGEKGKMINMRKRRVRDDAGEEERGKKHSAEKRGAKKDSGR